jgi:hypothetical protein
VNRRGFFGRAAAAVLGMVGVKAAAPAVAAGLAPQGALVDGWYHYRIMYDPTSKVGYIQTGDTREFVLCERLLTKEERTKLYNGGKGLTYNNWERIAVNDTVSIGDTDFTVCHWIKQVQPAS